MNSMIIFIIFVCILALLFLSINLVIAPHNPYQEKYSIFECGFHSFLSQNRIPAGVKFFMYAICFLIFDLEIFTIFPYTVSGYLVGGYGLASFLIFVMVVSTGFIFEVGKGALFIKTKQDSGASASLLRSSEGVHLEKVVKSS